MLLARSANAEWTNERFGEQGDAISKARERKTPKFFLNDKSPLEK
jgi:hypothetical protein